VLLKNDAVTLGQPVDYEVFGFLWHVCTGCQCNLSCSTCHLRILAFLQRPTCCTYSVRN
jgi:hypothetical protein